MARISAEMKEQVRTRLLEAAAVEFAAKGLAAANMDAIAVAAGYGKGTVYNYFPSKEQLFVEVLTEGCRQAVQRGTSIESRGSVREDLLALAEADVAVLRDQEQFMKVVVREAMSFRPETYPLIVEHLSPYLEAIEKIIARAGPDQIRGDLSTAQLALMFVGILTILYVQHWGSEGAWPTLDTIPRLAVSMFLDGVSP